jgi:hypothetical protein
MKNQCIKVLNEEHGKKVIEYFKNSGIDTKELTGDRVKAYYGLFEGEFNFFDDTRDSEVIELPTEFKRGDKVLVWHNDENNAIEYIFLAKIEGSFFPYIVKTSNSEVKFNTVCFKNCKHAPQVVELTLQDISDGKGVGVDPKLIKII